MRFKGLIVDFGGVLTTPLQDAMQEFAEQHEIEFQDLVRAALRAYSGEGDDDLVVRFETGKLDEAEFALAFAQRLTELTGREIQAEGLLARLFGTLKLEHDMIAAVESARNNGFKTALLSNSWGLSLYPREILDRVCDVVIISGEVGLRKPDPAIFTMTTDQLALEPDVCVFVDDHPGHLKAAQEAGMTTVLHKSPRETIAELEGLLGLPLS